MLIAATSLVVYLNPLIAKAQQVTISPQCVSVRAYIANEFKDAPIMVRIAQAESQFDCSQKNPDSTAKGCFQILDGTWKDYKCEGGDHYEMKANVACARIIYDASGTQPWDASKANWQ